jgi:hypothetical protein
MRAFSVRTAAAKSSILATWLVRVVTYSLPTLVATEQGQGYALALTLFLGALDGWFRLRLARTARSLIADADALVISSGLDSVRVAWSNVLAIEVWHRLNRVDYVAVHYGITTGRSVVTCWDQDGRDELLLFVRECAVFARAAGPRRTIARARLGDQAVYLALLRHLLLDVALALLVGLLCGITSSALWLGTAAGLLSASMAATPYLCRSELVRIDGAWWRARRNGELARLRVVPRSLRLWAGYLSE